MITGIALLHGQSRAHWNHHERNRRHAFGAMTSPLHQNHRDSKLGGHRELGWRDISEHNRISLTINEFHDSDSPGTRDRVQR
jgi:hypothetical protein